MVLFQGVHGNNEPRKTERTWNVDPWRSSFKVESGHGERREIGRLAKVDFQRAEPAEHFDPEGHKKPRRGVEAGGALWSIGPERIR